MISVFRFFNFFPKFLPRLLRSVKQLDQFFVLFNTFEALELRIQIGNGINKLKISIILQKKTYPHLCEPLFAIFEFVDTCRSSNICSYQNEYLPYIQLRPKCFSILVPSFHSQNLKVNNLFTQRHHIDSKCLNIPIL